MYGQESCGKFAHHGARQGKDGSDESLSGRDGRLRAAEFRDDAVGELEL